MTELRELCENGAFLGGQYDAMRKILERTLNVQLREYRLPPSPDPKSPLADATAGQRDEPDKDAPKTSPENQTSEEVERSKEATA